jgi:hypothetical protein
MDREEGKRREDDGEEEGKKEKRTITLKSSPVRLRL